MNNNDILRRSRYILDLKDNQLVKIFKHVDRTVTDKQVNFWLKRDDEPEFIAMGDEDLIDFLDALIIEKRGRKDGPSIRFKQKLDNNLILMKLKIAFALKAEDVLAAMQLAEFKISKHELSALFRKKDHKHYRVCKNQILRKFMKGLQIKYRGLSKAITNSTSQKTEENKVKSEPKVLEKLPKNLTQDSKSTSKLKLSPSSKTSAYKKKTPFQQKDKKEKEHKTDKTIKPVQEKKTASVWKIPKKSDVKD